MPPSTFVGGSIDIFVRFESMGGNARRAQTYRRHEDLQKAYEHTVKGLTRETRYATEKMTRVQAEYLNRLKAIQRLEPQTYPEEWPPLDERREIITKLKEAQAAKDTAAEKAKMLSLRRKAKYVRSDRITNKKETTSPKSNPSPNTTSKHRHNDVNEVGRSTTINTPNHTTQSLPLMHTPESIKRQTSKPRPSNLKGTLSKPHWTRPSKICEKGPNCKDSTNDSAIAAVSISNNVHADNPVKLGHKSISLVERHTPTQEAMYKTNTMINCKSSVSRTNEQRQNVRQPKLHLPFQPVGSQGSHYDKMFRPRYKSRRTWDNSDNMFLFSVESKDGEINYKNVTKRRYPSIV